MSDTRISTPIDYERNGKQVDWLYLPHSVTASAYGNIALPIAVIRNGAGPTALLMAGNHGDEYEGQIALCRLIRELDPAEIQGRVIVMPAVNLPAAMASERISPIDGLNLNRVFPGEADGSPTRAIAHYLSTVLFPMADFAHDFHAGGGSLSYLPYAAMRRGRDPQVDARALAALKAFDPPRALIWGFSPDAGIGQVYGIHQGMVFLSGEFGGSGSVSRGGIGIVERGIRRVFAHLGMSELPARYEAAGEPELLEIRGKNYYVNAPEPGLFEPATELGDEVEAGQLCGVVHFVDNPARTPVPCHFHVAGRVICQRHPGRVQRGDCVAHLATPFSG